MIKRKDYDTFMGIKQVLSNKLGSSLPEKVVFVVTEDELKTMRMCVYSLEYRLSIMNRILDLYKTKSKNNRIKELL